MPAFVVPTRYRLRYWLFIIYAVGVPVFIKFDRTGETHNFGTFNPQSIAVIALTLLSAGILTAITLISRRNIFVRQVAFQRLPFIGLLIILVLATLISPRDNIGISFYRMGEWILGYLLLMSAYTREPFYGAAGLASKMVGNICWVSVAIVWLVLPVFPSLAFSVPEEITGSIQFRLGGYLIHPNALGVIAGVVFWYALLLQRSTKRFVLSSFALLTLLLTYSRGAWVGFVLSLIIYVFVSRRSAPRFIAGSLILGTAALSALFSNSLTHFLERGAGANNLETLSGRAMVWAAAIKGIQARPLIGYGYIDGVKHMLKQYMNVAYWSPIHCHNDLLQAAASGGIVAGAIVLWIYCRGIFHGMKVCRLGKNELFLFLAFIQVLVFTVVTPLLMTQFRQLGAILLICMVAFAEQYYWHRQHRAVAKEELVLVGQ